MSVISDVHVHNQTLVEPGVNITRKLKGELFAGGKDETSHYFHVERVFEGWMMFRA